MGHSFITNTFAAMFGKLKQIFQKQEELLDPVDLGLLKTDVHSHLIPGIDDGAQTMEDSIALLSRFQDLGYQKVITTPHVMSDYYRNDRDTIVRGCDQLRNAATEAGLSIDIDCAAEYYLDLEFMDMIKPGELLTFGDGYVLFELSFMSEPPMLEKAIFELQLAGYKPMLAHPERYAFWHQNFERYQEMIDRGVQLQLNINSLTGHYSPPVKKVAQQLIREGMISLVGSDCHHERHLDLLEKARQLEPLHHLVKGGKLLNHKL